MALKHIENIDAVADAFANYVEKLNATGFAGTYPYLEETIKDNIAHIRKGALKKLAKKDDVFAFYAELTNVRNKLLDMLGIFMDHQVNPNREGSQTSSGSTITQASIMDLYETLQHIRDIMDNFLTSSQMDEIVKELSARLLDKSVDFYTKEAVSVITSAYEKYTHTGCHH